MRHPERAMQAPQPCAFEEMLQDKKITAQQYDDGESSAAGPAHRNTGRTRKPHTS